MATKHQLPVEGQVLTLTNLEKVLYPAANFTKANVVDYYARARHFTRRTLPASRPTGFK